MTIMNFLSDIRNAAIANAVIVAFHIYVAFAWEGLDFLIIVLAGGALVGGAYFVKGKIGAALLAIPTLAYLFVVLVFVIPDMFGELTNSGGAEDIGIGIYILGPFWMFTV